MKADLNCSQILNYKDFSNTIKSNKTHLFQKPNFILSSSLENELTKQ